MCQGRPTGSPQNLHEKICHTTHGIPCRTAHALGNILRLILGRKPKEAECCGDSKPAGSCGCGGQH